MTKFIGRLVNLGVGKETIRGTAVIPRFWMPIDRINFDDVFGVEATGERYDSLSGFGEIAHTINKKAKGKISGDLGIDFFGLLLLVALGSVTTVGPTDSAYVHTFSLQDDNAHDSLTLVEVNPIGAFQYTFAMLEGLEIIVTPEKIVSFSASFSSKPSSII